MALPYLVAANWKMNGSRAENEHWLQAFGAAPPPPCDVVVCPPAVYLNQVVRALAGMRAGAGAQNLSQHRAGAWTGEVTAEMLLDVGVHWVIVGHSERRAAYGETDALVAAKAERALAAGLRPIVCVGETLAEREAGRTAAVVGSQIDAVLERCAVDALARGAIAYEPIWAIGTGRTASPEQAQEVHAAIRAQLAARDASAAALVHLLYGGSVKPANARELFAQPDIDGGLVGGASLVAEDFLAICAATAP
jgi:triosephosphate isomerase